MTDWRVWRFKCRRMALKSVVSCKTRKAGKQWRGQPSWYLPPDSQNRGGQSRFTKTAQTDQSGRFSLEGLVPAEYRVCALTDHEPGRESELDYLISLGKGLGANRSFARSNRGGIPGGVAGRGSVLNLIHGQSCSLQSASRRVVSLQ